MFILNILQKKYLNFLLKICIIILLIQLKNKKICYERDKSVLLSVRERKLHLEGVNENMDNGALNYRRFLDGDDKSFARIVDDYKNGLMIFLNGYVRNIYIAEKLTEDTFFVLASKKPGENKKYSFKTWIYSLGREKAIQSSKKYNSSENFSIDEMREMRDDEESLEREFLQSDEKLYECICINQLSEEERQILWLHDFENFSNDELSFILKLKPDTISGKIENAYDNLKKIKRKEEAEI